MALLVALAYLFGLGGDHIPRNGDELVYANIARLTAASGHWLPLQSAWDFMRNTKPPLLFWQAMVAGGWGEHWTLLRLRLPSVAYTWGITLMVALLTWKTVRDGAADAAGASATPAQRSRHALTMGAIAALVYLSFFTTYRYGRPYLTSAPETFWLFGVFFALAWSPARLLASHWKFPLIAGIAVGIGCLYKSFVMVVPVGFALALCYQAVGAQVAPWQVFRPGIVRDGIKVAVICALGLGIFGLWFALDPQPGEVWREFVVGENAGKMNNARGYFKTAFSGGSGILTILTGYFSNALFLLPLSIGGFVAAWRGWRQRRGTLLTISPAEKIMWLWLLALALVFMLPTQRSTRYLIPAMPALAVVIAVYWQRIGRIWFSLTLAVCMIGLLAMGLIGYGAVRATQNPWVLSPLFWVYVAGAALACGVSMFKKSWTRPLAAVAGFSVVFALAWVTNPFNGELGRFKPETHARLIGQTVQVPSNFNGHFERYEFIIPGAKIAEYFAAQPVDYADVEGLF
ncbi:MAG: 4-amino-4-deoxy-L-arabinose transferase and related glycosyltransferase of family-like protein [Polaromonas sp.]|nr:4-amino-4-deoxy-L-arabinose transferase and related glycosyltransferase of family-like protein [Polaromonas sp.]